MSGLPLQECDIWSVGIILYFLLCGEPPFYSHRHGDLVRLIKAAELSFHEPPWRTVSESARDLIRRLLRAEASERYTANEALVHPWVQGKDDMEASQPMPTVFEMIRMHQAEMRFKKAAYVHIAVAFLHRQIRRSLVLPAVQTIDKGTKAVVRSDTTKRTGGSRRLAR